MGRIGRVLRKVVPKKSMFGMKPKSKRRAEEISIESAEAFRRSIGRMKRGRYTRAEQRSLVLAKNRAVAQLKRRNLTPKVRKRFETISKMPIPKLKKRRTRIPSALRRK